MSRRRAGESSSRLSVGVAWPAGAVPISADGSRSTRWRPVDPAADRLDHEDGLPQQLDAGPRGHLRPADGRRGIYGVVDKDDFAVVIAEEDGGFHLVEQFRYAVGRRSWEFPMGTWAAGNPAPSRNSPGRNCWRRPGSPRRTWRRVGLACSRPAGFCSQGFDLFHATDLTQGQHDREDSEADMVQALVSEAEFRQMIARRPDLRRADHRRLRRAPAGGLTGRLGGRVALLHRRPPGRVARWIGAGPRDGPSREAGCPDRATPPRARRRPTGILTVPNLLSFLRLLGVPLFLYLLLVPQYDGWALVVLAISAITDWADGKLARLLNQYSRLGELLDPAADRLYILAALVGFVIRGFIPWWVAALIIGRDVLLAATLPVLRRYGYTALPVHYLGKAATFCLDDAYPDGGDGVLLTSTYC